MVLKTDITICSVFLVVYNCYSPQMCNWVILLQRVQYILILEGSCDNIYTLELGYTERETPNADWWVTRVVVPFFFVSVLVNSVCGMAPLLKKYNLPPQPSWNQTLIYHIQRVAKQALDTIKIDTPFPSSTLPLPGKAYLIINRAITTKNFHTAITHAWCTSDLCRYLTHKYCWNSHIKKALSTQPSY